MANDAKADKTLWLLLGILFSIIAAIVVGIAFFGKCESNGIDKIGLACRWTGSVMDIIGLVIFLGGLIWWAGQATKVYNFFSKKDVSDVYMYGSRGEANKNLYIGFVALILGMALIFI